jgi:hypothetical protein
MVRAEAAAIKAREVAIADFMVAGMCVKEHWRWAVN